MFQILYASSATRHLSAPELDALLQVCRRNNATSDVTGLLLYCDGNFIQLLEGEENAVRALYDRILRDPRHWGLFVLQEGETERREFETWSMGYCAIEPGEQPVLDTAFVLTAESLEQQLAGDLSLEVLIFMRNFYRITRGYRDQAEAR